MPPFLLARRRSLAGYSRAFVVNMARLLWITLVVLREIGSFFWSLSACSWPDSRLSAAGEDAIHVLLVADSQARLEPFGSGPLSLMLYDSFLRRAWHVVMRLKPHIVIFLGDMMSPGVTVARDNYGMYASKHKELFPTSAHTFYLPGNNDVGLGQSSTQLKYLRKEYSRSFGPFNQKLSVKNHTLILLDSPGIVGEDYARTAKGVEFSAWKPLSSGPVEFVTELTRGPLDEPIILLSHIPFFRPDSASCGPLRERGSIRRGVGTGYQNTLGKQTTAHLLGTLRPSAVFSADNRDYCEHEHHTAQRSEVRKVREVTVKSFSPARHIRNPGFQLLSLTTPMELVPSSEQRSFVDQPCTLPNISISYTTIYWPLAFATFFLLFYINTLRARRSRAPPPSLPPSPRSRSKSPLHSPLLHPQPDSAVWSPYTPITTSPKSSFPATLRTPYVHPSSTPTLQAFAHPTTPRGSPLLTPLRFPTDDGDPSIYPVQYANHDLDGSFHEDGDQEGGSTTLFLPPPPPFSLSKRRPGISWTFTFRGRRRCMRIPLPHLSWRECGCLLRDVISGSGTAFPTRSAAVTSLVDSLAVFWPPLLCWFMIVCWFF